VFLGAVKIPPIVNKVQGTLVLEKILTKHGVVHFRITPNPSLKCKMQMRELLEDPT
jgi:hypothetical protein